ncbi:MAG: ATP synthase F0 subunit B [Spirochaetaceae bacterium]|jgi:F-type H+-transporting ATPase subunit b|nr:ATP synthase F0 subunit B [Spirochaetaceae bacterium]
MKLIDFSVTFILTLVNISILCFILRAILFKPVTKFASDRAAKIKNDIDSAAHDREEAKKLRLQYEEKLNEADAEARVIAEASRKTAEDRAKEIISQGKIQAEALIAAARKQIDTERQAAYFLLKAEAASLVVRASSRLLGREFSGEDIKQFAESAINECAVPPGRTV